MAGIYIHIPFCRRACSYCDFYFSTGLNNKEAVVNAICNEIRYRKEYLGGESLSSIYFGGGTPSLLSTGELGNIMLAVSENFSIDANAEITLEANPDDVSNTSLRQWQDHGINRLSIGLQSFNDEELKWMNRAHTAAESLASVKMAQDKGFDNITIDLIYGSRFQTLRSWEKTLRQAIDLETKHISSYNLTIEKKTLLGSQYQKGKEPAINDELSSGQFLMMVEALGGSGFIQYEISNFGKAGFFAVHNSNYWKGERYLGAGPSAHSFNGTSRQWNVANNNIYVQKMNKGEAYYETEELGAKERYNEYVMTRLRTIWGCDTQEMRTLFGEEPAQFFENGIQRWSAVVNKEGSVYTLSLNGKLQADGIASDLFMV